MSGPAITQGLVLLQIDMLGFADDTHGMPDPFSTETEDEWIRGRREVGGENGSRRGKRNWSGCKISNLINPHTNNSNKNKISNRSVIIWMMFTLAY